MIVFLKIFGLMCAVLFAVALACSCIEWIVDRLLGD